MLKTKSGIYMYIFFKWETYAHENVEPEIYEHHRSVLKEEFKAP